MLRLAAAAEGRFDRLRFRLRRRLGRIGPVILHPYRGHGSERAIYLRGRVLEDPGLAPGQAGDAPWINARAVYRRFRSAEIPRVRVHARFGSYEQTVQADDEGYFFVHLPIENDLDPSRSWQSVALTLLDAVGSGPAPARAVGEVLVPPPEATFGVISDIDDTVLQTGATSWLQMARTTLFNNVHTRLPFEGVAAFYRALQGGPTGTGHHPVFYVSSSPWNLYDVLERFMDLNGIPLGPLFLRDLGLDRVKFIKSGHHAHKRDAIEHILAAHPHLPFVLVGDSGQHDPEIYRDVARDHPDRIAVIYVRDVSPPSRDAEVQGIAEAVRARGTEMVLVQDSVGAARHAAGRGLIDPAALPDVAAERAKDRA